MKLEDYKQFVHALYESEFEPIKEEYLQFCCHIQNDIINYPELNQLKKPLVDYLHFSFNKGKIDVLINPEISIDGVPFDIVKFLLDKFYDCALKVYNLRSEK